MMRDGPELKWETEPTGPLKGLEDVDMSTVVARTLLPT